MPNDLPERCCGRCEYHDSSIIQLFYFGGRVEVCTNPESHLYGREVNPTDGTDCHAFSQREEGTGTK